MSDDGPQGGERGDGGATASPSPSSLAALVRGSASGDRGAFAQLFDLTSPRLYGLIVRIVGDRGYAEEILQESYLQIWESADRYEEKFGSALSWMLTIAHRRAVDRVRSEQSARRREEADAMHSPAEQVDIAEGVAESMASRELATDVRRCVDDLSSVQRQAIELAYFGGLTYRDVAERLGAALPTVKSRIRDGLRNLKKCLGGEPR
ncbi:ECF RNA polymerase sigma factor SigK [Dietzia timorensis]|nr:ECF RNA polymerase sigma factor SigK [Dietzia timorensis]